MKDYILTMFDRMANGTDIIDIAQSVDEQEQIKIIDNYLDDLNKIREDYRNGAEK